MPVRFAVVFVPVPARFVFAPAGLAPADFAPVLSLRDAVVRDFFTAALAFRAFVFVAILLTVFRS
jgi:hypothetical protein